jgi:hypothetical protein
LLGLRRCPTECKLSYSPDKWKCLVTLRFIEDGQGQNIGQAKTVPFGEPILEKSQVEERIRRAQRAILNPSTDHVHFLEGLDVDPPRREQTFSRNCVSLQISGSEVADLSFVDLPGNVSGWRQFIPISSNTSIQGLIANTTTGSSGGDIKLIENLIKQYIEKPSCIILLAIACES